MLWQSAPSAAPAPMWYENIIKAGIVPALITALAALSVALLTTMFNRTVAKRAPKTELRAIAYGDFVAYHMRRPPTAPPAVSHCPDLNDILARLLVFGEDKVISQVATFLQTPGEGDLTLVITKMRESVKTNHEGEAADAIKAILRSRASRFAGQDSPPR